MCSQPAAADAGAAVLAGGGSAFDAAVAAAFLQAVVDPLNAGVGGFGVAQLVHAGSPFPESLSFHARAPLLARPDMFEVTGEMSLAPLAAGTWPVRGDANQIGYLSVGIPGTVAGLAAIAERHGSVPWPDLLAPAARTAGEGWRVSGEQFAEWTREGPASRLDARSRLAWSEYGASVYAKNRALPGPGERVVNPDLASTLERLARAGAEDFYRGEIAAAIVRDFQTNGGLIRHGDLEHFRLDEAPPLETTYRGCRLTVPPAPAGGPVLLEILRRLERHDLRALGHNSASYIRLLASAMRAAFGRMREQLGDPEPAGGPEATTPLLVWDSAGNAVSLTHTLGAASGVITPGLGFLYNGAMHRFDPVPGRPNSIAPGKRRLTGMSPAIVFRGGRPAALVAGAGGNSIVAGIAQVILNLIDFDMEPAAATAAARAHCEGQTITLEGRFGDALASELLAAGEEVTVSSSGFDRLVAANVHAFATPSWKRPGAGPDPRSAAVAREL